jgi:hypothetical protein
MLAFCFAMLLIVLLCIATACFLFCIVPCLILLLHQSLPRVGIIYYSSCIVVVCFPVHFDATHCSPCIVNVRFSSCIIIVCFSPCCCLFFTLCCYYLFLVLHCCCLLLILVVVVRSLLCVVAICLLRCCISPRPCHVQVILRK